MFSRRFAAWVGVGLLSVATIPAVAAPRLARYTAHNKPAAKAPVSKTAPKPAAKAPVKAPAKHETKAVVAEKSAAPHAAPVKKSTTPAKSVTAARPRPKSATHGRRPARAAAHKAAPGNHATASAPATAKKLFH